MIELERLTKRYGDRTAVDGVTFTVRPGVVTGFLGPNGAGKSTTLRILVGLDAPTAGVVRVNGGRYAGFRAPLREVGVALEARSAHPGRTAYHHLTALAHTHGIPRARVDEVVGMAGLEGVAGKRAGSFSLGMGQRLGIAAALLGDPATLVLDEPVGGLDPEGVRWVRRLLTSLAAEGRTVLLSSHLMSEMALTAEHLVIIARGRLLADTTVEAFVREADPGTVKVVSPEAGALAELLRGPGAGVVGGGPGVLHVTGVEAERIGATAAQHGIPVHELTPHAASLEEAFMELTGQGSGEGDAEGGRVDAARGAVA